MLAVKLITVCPSEASGGHALLSLHHATHKLLQKQAHPPDPWQLDSGQWGCIA